MVIQESKTLRKKINEGEIDPNNSSLFFADAIKASIFFLNNNIKLRNKRVPHIIINTGDDILYRELMDYSYSKTEITDENFVYNEIPRGVITATEINTLPDQLTQPYVRSYFDIEYENSLYEFTAETRRMPIKMNINVKYYLDSFTDCLELSQYLITQLSYIRTFQFDYLGNAIMCSLKFPDAFSSEVPSTITFDSESRYKNISIDLELETNIPIFDCRTAIESSTVIMTTINNINNLHNRDRYIGDIRSVYNKYSYLLEDGKTNIYWIEHEKPILGSLLMYESGNFVVDDKYLIYEKYYITKNGHVVEIIESNR